MNKHLLKNILIQFLTSRPISAISSRILGYGIPIFMVHRTYPDNTPQASNTPSHLRKCLQYLKDNGYKLISVRDIISYLNSDKTLPRKCIAFTIDDGFVDQASLAAPVFLEFDCPVTIFLTTGFMDGELWPWFAKVEYLINASKQKSIRLNIAALNQSFSLGNHKDKSHARNTILESMKKMQWDKIPTTLVHLEQITQVEIPVNPPESYEPMGWDTARKLEEAGIQFGPHSVTHPIMSRVNDDQSQFEIARSWQRIKEELNSPTPVFCYPNGQPDDYGIREINTIKNNGLIGAISTVHAQVKANISSIDYTYNLPRYPLLPSYEEFIKYCSWIEYYQEVTKKE